MTRRIIPHAPAATIGGTVLAMGEVVVDETSGQLRVGDGSTPGGNYPALPTGAAGVGLVANLENPATRDVQDKLGDIIDLRDTGAVGLNGSGDAALIQSMLNANDMIGRTIHGLRGQGAAAAFKITGASWTLARQIDLELEKGIDLRADQTTGQRFDALSVNVLQTEGETSPSTSGEYRGGWFRGPGRIFTYNTTTGALDTLAGGYAIDVGAGSAKPTIGLTIEKMNLGGGLGAVRFTNAGGSELQWSQLVRCTLTNGVIFDAEDGEIAVDCISGGANPGYSIDLAYGAFCCGVFRGTIANSGGGVDIVNGGLVKIMDVQIEHSGTAATSLLGGGHIAVQGAGYPSYGVDIIGCNFGAGVYITNTVTLAASQGTRIYRNTWNIAGPAGVSADLLLIRNASDADNDAYDTILGYDQNLRGTRALQSAVGSLTDVSRRMVIALSGGTLRQPHRGMWLGDFYALLTDKATNLASDGFELMIEHSGRVAINGGFSRGGGSFFTNGLTVCRFPTWCLPVRTQIISVHDDVGNHTSAYLFVGGANDGLLVLNGAQLATSAKLYFSSTWMAVTNPDYRAPA